MSDPMLIIAVGIVMLGVVGCVWAYREEKRSWNGGWCPRCTGKWKSFDMDSQGGRGYKCPSGHYTWISYPGVDRD